MRAKKILIVVVLVLAAGVNLALFIGGMINRNNSNNRQQQEAEEELLKELGAFDITAHQRELANNNEAGYVPLDAGRGNPNWINTKARYAFTRFCDFAARECELDFSEGDMAGHAKSRESVIGLTRQCPCSMRQTFF